VDATQGKEVKGGSSTSSSPAFGVRKDTPSSQKLTVGINKLNLR